MIEEDLVVGSQESPGTLEVRHDTPMSVSGGVVSDAADLAVILDKSRAITGAPLAMLNRMEPTTQRLFRVATIGAAGPPPAVDALPLGVGLVGRCAAEGKVILSNDVLADGRVAFPVVEQQLGVRAALHVPLSVDGLVIGVLSNEAREIGHFSDEHVQGLTAYAKEIASTIAGVWARDDAAGPQQSESYPRLRYRERLRRVRELSAKVHGLNDLKDVFDHALRAMAELTWAARVFIALVDRDAGVIRMQCGLGVTPELMAETVRPVHDAPTPDEDILAHVVRTREPAFTRHYDPRLNRATAARHGVSRYALTVPLIGHSGVLGTLTSGWNHDALTDPEMLEIMTILADHVGPAIEMHRLLDVERRLRLIAEELHVVAQRITAELSLEDALAAVLRAVERLFGAASASIYLLERSGFSTDWRYTTRYTGEPHWDDRASRSISPHGGIAEVVKTGKPIVVDDIQSDPRTRDQVDEDTRTVAAVPVFHGDRIIGVLHANWRERRACGQDDLRLLETLAAYGAIAIENARLHEREIADARLDGVLLAARTAAHEINNDLAVTMGMAEVALDQSRNGRVVDPRILEGVVKGAERVARHVRQLQGVARLEERHYTNLPPVLDLDRSSGQPVNQDG